MIYEYKGKIYPDYLKTGNAAGFILPIAQHFCQGKGLDIGCNKWPFPGAALIDPLFGGDAMELPDGEYDYIFSSHCLEHLVNPIAALKHWKSRLKKGGVLFLYLPHPDMEYWLPQNCEKHLHKFDPYYMACTLWDLGFTDVMNSERDFAWSFTVVGFNA